MKPDKKQLPQLAVLGLLVVACVGVIAFQFAAPKKSAPTAATARDRKAAAERKADASDPNAARVASAEVALVPSSVFPNLTSTPPRRDPFRPTQLPGVEENVQNPSRPVPSSQSVRAASPGAFPRNPLPFNPFKDLTGGSGPAIVPQPGGPGQPEQEKDPEFTLTGIIRGDSNVAIIRTGEGGRYIVRQGQFIDGRYRVVAVTDNGAVLAHNNRRIYVKLGGVKNER